MRDNLLYGLYHDAPPLEPDGTAEKAAALKEAQAIGAPLLDPDGDWAAYDAAGVADAAALDARLVTLVREAGMAPDLLATALSTRLDEESAAAWRDALMAARAQLRVTLAYENLGDAVARWSRDAFNPDGSVLDNILFAPPPDEADATAALLARIGAEPLLVELGWALGAEFAEVVETVGRESGVLDSLGGYSRSEALTAVDLVESNRDRGVDGASKAARRGLLDIAVRFTPARDRFEVVDAAMEARILDLREKALAARPDATPFDAEAVSPGATISETVLGGPRRQARRSVWRRLDALMLEAAETAGVTDALLRIALDSPVAAGGSTQARRRIGLVRALVKRPTLLILNGPGAGDTDADAGLRRLARREAPDATFLFLAQPAAARDADYALRLGPSGAFQSLDPIDRPTDGSAP
jgi:putative ABC transport system ATP-binding protein